MDNPAEIDHLFNQTTQKTQDKLWQLKCVYDVYFKEQPMKSIHIIQHLPPPEDVMEAKFLTGPVSNVQFIKERSICCH